MKYINHRNGDNAEQTCLKWNLVMSMSLKYEHCYGADILMTNCFSKILGTLQYPKNKILNVQFYKFYQYLNIKSRKPNSLNVLVFLLYAFWSDR